MKRLFTFIFIFMSCVFHVAAQQDDRAKYQDTVFIRHNKDWTKDTLDYVTDTVIFRSGMQRHILVGTDILTGTEGQLSGWGFGVHLNKVLKSDCQKDVTETGLFPAKINSIIRTDSSLTVDINLSANCCYDFLCDMEIDSTGILDLKYQGYGTYCSCYCCFGLTYCFTIENSKDKPDIKAVMINGKRKTMKIVKNKR